jgi:hypothetical protein
MSPIESLRAWLLLFVDYIAAKHIIATALNSVAGGPFRLYEGSRSLIQGAIEELVPQSDLYRFLWLLTQARQQNAVWCSATRNIENRLTI